MLVYRSGGIDARVLVGFQALHAESNRVYGPEDSVLLACGLGGIS